MYRYRIGLVVAEALLLISVVEVEDLVGEAPKRSCHIGHAHSVVKTSLPVKKSLLTPLQDLAEVDHTFTPIGTR